MSGLKMDADAFFRRTDRLYRAWRGQDPSDLSSAGADAIFVGVGVDEDLVYSRSTSLQTWLVGHELTDTLAVFCADAVHFLASKKKVDFLRPLETASENYPSVPGVRLHVRDKVRGGGRTCSQQYF